MARVAQNQAEIVCTRIFALPVECAASDASVRDDLLQSSRSVVPEVGDRAAVPGVESASELGLAQSQVVRLLQLAELVFAHAEHLAHELGAGDLGERIVDLLAV